MQPAPYPLPARFHERMELLLGSEFPAFLESIQRPPLQGLRINTLKIDPAEVAGLLPWPLEPVPWCPSGFTIDPQHRPGRHPLHAAGLYYLQEPSAMAVAEALDVLPGQCVLDISAAPGGKATHLASLLQGEGVLVTNDPVPSRIKALGENLERWGCRNAVITNSAVQELAAAWPETFDRVLVDAPCSGEGMFRKSLAARQEWSEAHVQGCAWRQKLLLNDAATMVRPGGLLLYSTCTFAPEENEAQICHFLEQHPAWELVDIPKRQGMRPGVSDWVPACPADVRRMARLWPHLIAGEGHTMALLRAPASEEPVSRLPASRWSLTTGFEPPSSEALAAGRHFHAANLVGFEPEGTLIQRGDQGFLMPEGAPALHGVRVVRPGLPLGTVRRGRFEPSHALALALSRDTARDTLELDPDSVERYLRGETVNAPGPPGWVLMAFQGFPLGWGKRTGETVKNHYPRGLRRPSS